MWYYFIGMAVGVLGLLVASQVQAGDLPLFDARAVEHVVASAI